MFARRLDEAILLLEEPHKFSSTQFNLADGGYSRSQGSPVDKIAEMLFRIPEEDLAGDGREHLTHVTVKYGLHTEDEAEVREVVKGFGPVEITLGATSIFAADDSDTQRGGDQHDVVKIEVQGEDIRRLNKLISSKLECTDTHPTYKPHVTLAYVKAGCGEKYVGWDDVEGMTLSFDELLFSSKNGGVMMLKLTGADNAEEE